LMLTAAFFADNQAGIMFAITLCGWAIALIVSLFLRKTVFRGASTPFVMELPPYRMPTLRSILTHTWERGWMYIKKAGTVILAISIVLWAALTFPELGEEQAAPFEEKIASFEEKITPLSQQMEALKKALESADTAAKSGLQAQLDTVSSQVEALEEEKAEVENALASETVRNTIGGRIGQLVEPIFRPLGFDWRTDVALLSGVAAKEAILSTMGTAYSIGETDPDEPDSLSEKLASDSGWSKTVALALMLFVLIYSPCFVTLVVLKNEAGGWKWVFFSMAFNTAVAYIAAYAGTIVGNILWG
ncbi:MAG: nucleoside recognition domain-containing protein, partial [Mailhella sp.]